MKFYSIMLDDIAHTIVYLVHALSEEDALKKFSVSEAGAECLPDGKWIIRDYGDESYNEYFDDIKHLVNDYWSKKSIRFEIQEIKIDFKKEVQGIFCSKEKEQI